MDSAETTAANWHSAMDAAAGGGGAGGGAGQAGGFTKLGERTWLLGDGGEDMHRAIEYFDAATVSWRLILSHNLILTSQNMGS